MSQVTENHRRTIASPQEEATESSLLPMLIGGLVLMILAMVVVALIV